MNKFLHYVFGSISYETLQTVILILRVSIGILTIPHGIPKLFGGYSEWRSLGETFMFPLGIHFFPIIWGFIGACTEFFGGILLILGFATRIASFFLMNMMIIATVWHIKKGDSFNIYSFPLSLIFVYFFFLIIGGNKFSLDHYFFLEV